LASGRAPRVQGACAAPRAAVAWAPVRSEGSPPASVYVVNHHPMLRIVAPAASPQEAAAIVAALERFTRDTAPAPPVPRPARPTAWARAALMEGTEHAPGGAAHWGRG
jgi:hypothetical protein